MGRKKRNKIVFDKEVVTKEVAEKIVTEHKIDPVTEGTVEEILSQGSQKENSTKAVKKKKQKQRGSQQKLQNTDADGRVESEIRPKRKKKPPQESQQEQNADEQTTRTKKRKLDSSETQDEATSAPAEEQNLEKATVKNEESIRAKKRKKHAELLQKKKLEAELALQQKCLNYVSQWKHNREEWKFEKLKQVWLQQNMFTSSKVPDDFWEILVEYFCGSQGKARQMVLQDALKIIEEEEDETVEKAGGWDVKLKRARDIIQNLQE